MDEKKKNKKNGSDPNILAHKIVEKATKNSTKISKKIKKPKDK